MPKLVSPITAHKRLGTVKPGQVKDHFMTCSKSFTPKRGAIQVAVSNGSDAFADDGALVSKQHAEMLKTIISQLVKTVHVMT